MTRYSLYVMKVLLNANQHRRPRIWLRTTQKYLTIFLRCRRHEKYLPLSQKWYNTGPKLICKTHRKSYAIYIEWYNFQWPVSAVSELLVDKHISKIKYLHCNILLQYSWTLLYPSYCIMLMSDSTIATVHLKFFSTKSLYYNFPDFQINCYFIVRAVHNISLTDVMSIRTVYEIFVLLLLVLVEQAYSSLRSNIYSSQCF